MAGGINHAKKIVIDEAKELADDLSNGNGSDPKKQGQAIALIVKMLTPMYEADFVTKEDCAIQHELLKKDIESKSEVGNLGDITEFNVGPMHIKGKLNFMMVMMVLMFVGVLFAIAKTEGWL